MSTSPRAATLDRNLAIEMVRVTEAAAMAAGRVLGWDDKELADQLAVDAMRSALDAVEVDGEVVIGEGEKDKAPMLYIGERVGTGREPHVDIAVDPIEGTTLVANGMPGAVSVITVAERGTMLRTHVAYMDKIAVGPGAEQAIDITKSPAENLHAIADALGVPTYDLTVVVLDRPRHKELLTKIRSTGARLRLIPHGDVLGTIMAANEEFPNAQVLMGIGGATEGVVGACAVKCLGGNMQARFWPRDEAEQRLLREEGFHPDQVLQIDDLCSAQDVSLALTGISDSDLVEGVQYSPRRVRTHSLAMRSRSHSLRRIETSHDVEWLKKIGRLYTVDEAQLSAAVRVP
ncbi:MAG TPA: class II fructose-bisphosphatase [Chloroflexota bacterium]